MSSLKSLEDASDRFQLRDYQQAFLDRLYAQLRSGAKKIACIAPTGSGKTVLMAQIAEHAVQANCRVLILVHLDVLVGQTYEKMQRFGLAAQCGFIKAGWQEDRAAPMQIASVQTMAKRRWWRHWPADVVIYDEAHQTLFSKVGQEIRYHTHGEAIVLAFTATPYRLNRHEGLGDHLETLVTAPTPAELQRMGMLASMKYFGLPTADQILLDGIRTVAGDYSESDLRNACDRPELIQRIVEEWQRLTPGKRTIAFCVDVEHARHVAAAFEEIQVPAAVVSGDTPLRERQYLYQALANGSLLVLSSCNVISIGFDRPEVEVGLLLRPTQSLALHHQQIGRVMRIAPGKAGGIILDQSGNLLRLGFPEDIDSYELTEGSRSNTGQPIPKKQCPQCNCICHNTEPRCPSCGFTFVLEDEKPIHGADLVELMSHPEIQRVQAEAEFVAAYHALRQEAYSNRRSPSWAALQFKAAFGMLPKRLWAKGSIFGRSPREADYAAYLQVLKAVAIEEGKHHNWIHEEFIDEFGNEAWYWISDRIFNEVKPELEARSSHVTRPISYRY